MAMITDSAPLAPHVLRRRVRGDLPLLRRFARSLTGDQRMADTAVLQVVTDLLTPTGAPDTAIDLRPRLYQQLRRSLIELGACPDGHGRTIGSTPVSRQVQLLMRVEGFNVADTAMVLDIAPAEVLPLLGQLEQEMEAQPVAQVLIIEDEPLISLQLESLVTELGHNVIGSAPTRRQAVQLVKDRKVDLVLSDVQLADNSSGIEAVMEIQQACTPWVIFITAYPERLLTGERPEPLFLLSKPFNSDAVKATISQALFLAHSCRLSSVPGA